MKTKYACLQTFAALALSCGGTTFVGSPSDGGSRDASAGSAGSAGSGAGANGSGGSAASGGYGGSSNGGSAGAAGSGGAGGGQEGGSGADAGSCATNCGAGLRCCGSTCINPNNDILNCGSCNHRCSGSSPFCDRGSCGVAPCEADAAACQSGGGACCASQCCTGGQICCRIMAGAEATLCADPVNGTCPAGCPACLCASPDTSIATPEGPRRIDALRAGDLVYSVDHGEFVVVPIEATQRIKAQRHLVQHVVLESGAILEISGRHPTADGRIFADLRRGDRLDGVEIRDVTTIPYAHEFTYDILPASESGAYFAGGVLVGSTMATRPVPVRGVTVPMSY
jgi:hypothetical protein